MSRIKAGRRRRATFFRNIRFEEVENRSLRTKSATQAWRKRFSIYQFVCYSETSIVIRLWMFTRKHNLMNAIEEATSRLTFLSPGKYITMSSELWIFYIFLYIFG